MSVDSAGTVFVKVEPDVEDFTQKLETAIREKLESVEIVVTLKVEAPGS